MQRGQLEVYTLVILCFLSLLLSSCPSNDDDDCENIEGDWDFTVIETWDCDGNAETTPEINDILITQTDCEISFTGRFRKNLSDIMPGAIEGSSFSIDYYDNEANCTLRIRGNVNSDHSQLSGTWDDDCYDAADNCFGESGTFTAIPD